MTAHRLIISVNGQKVCPECGHDKFIGMQYWGTSEDYDGVSEWICDGCARRYGRWTGRELLSGELEPRRGGY